MNKDHNFNNSTASTIRRLDAPHGPLLIFGSQVGHIVKWGKCARISLIARESGPNGWPNPASVEACVSWLERLITISEQVGGEEAAGVQRALAFVQNSDDGGLYCSALLDIPKDYSPRLAGRLVELSNPEFSHMASTSFSDPLEVTFALGSLGLVPMYNHFLF